LKLCRHGGKVGEEGSTLVSLQWAHVWKGDYDRVVALKEIFLDVNKHQFNLLNYVVGLSATALAYSKMGKWNRALAHGEQALKSAEEHSNNSLISYAACVLSYIRCLQGDPALALESAKVAEEKSPSIGNKVLAQGSLAWALIRLGELNEGIELGTRLLPLFRAIRLASSEIWTAMIVGEGYLGTQNYEQAQKMIKTALTLAEDCGMKFFIGWGYRMLGEIALKTDINAAKQHFEKSITVFHEIESENELALTYTGLARYYKLRGNTDKSKQYLQKALKIFARLQNLGESEKVRKKLLELQ
jgi:tetratricopeptide (TPR) repeat protein